MLAGTSHAKSTDVSRIHEKDQGKLEVLKEEFNLIEEAQSNRIAHPPNDAQASPAETMNLFWGVWNKRRFIAKVMMVAIPAIIIAVFCIPPEFESTTQLMPPDGDQTSNLAALGALGGNPGLGSIAAGMVGIKNTSDLYLSVLRSRTVQDRIVEQFKLKDTYRVRLQRQARDRLASRTTLAVDRKTGIITITVRDRNRERVSKIAAAYVTELNRVITEQSTSSARRQREFLENRIAQVEKDLNAAATNLGEFSSKNRTINVEEEGKALMTAAAQMQQALISAEAEADALKQTYSENNVRVHAAEARVAVLRSSLEKLGGSTKEPGNPSIDGAGTIPSLTQLPLLGTSYAEYYRNTKLQTGIFELLTQQYELAKMQEAKEIPSVRVLDPASIPEWKAGPPRLALVLLTTLLTFFGLTVAVATHEYWMSLNETDCRKELLRRISSCVEDDLSVVRIRLRFGRG